ncbi:hypothetical protein [Priestia koreensis]|uniref:hypothetical protein n=1 Tax=Priestia koreensis TaxID=284581 RepID=UPI00203D7972|nr:hypothetical protein [Priestia koreensis]MCM3003664.1 hypothetical protein [Priestia koreensis]
MDVQMMVQAYGMLYHIETTLKQTVETIMTNQYGLLWRRKLKEEEKEYLYEIISIFGKYKPLITIFTPLDRKKLYELIPIRNKICHMKHIAILEYKFLEECLELVTRTLKTNSSILT